MNVARSEHDTYLPVVIEYWLRHWRELEDAAIGGTGPGYASSRGGRHGRMTLVAIKIDLERAADELPLHWWWTQRIFRLQGRWKVYLKRRDQAGLPAGTAEGLGFPECCERMARTLGWMPQEDAA